MWSHREEGPGHCSISKKLLSVQISTFDIQVESYCSVCVYVCMCMCMCMCVCMCMCMCMCMCIFVCICVCTCVCICVCVLSSKWVASVKQEVECGEEINWTQYLKMLLAQDVTPPPDKALPENSIGL